MESLIIEKSEAFRRIKEELTPRINGEIGVSVQEKIECEQERAELSNRIAEIDAELARMQELPPGEEVKTEPILSTVDGLPLAVFAKNEDAAILIQCEAESIVEAAVKFERRKSELEIQSLKTMIEHGKSENESLIHENGSLRDYAARSNNEIEGWKSLIDEQREWVQQLTLERDQALLYRDNAAKQLEDMAFELEQMKIELNRNREVRALTEAERTAEQEAARQRFLDSRIKIYNPRNATELNSRERIANLAETGEEITYLAIYEKGTYVDIGSEAALAIQAMNAELNAPEVDEEAIFPETASGESTSSLDATEDQGEQREALEVEPETFEERTERRLNAIEHRLNKNEPVIIQEVA